MMTRRVIAACAALPLGGVIVACSSSPAATKGSAIKPAASSPAAVTGTTSTTGSSGGTHSIAFAGDLNATMQPGAVICGKAGKNSAVLSGSTGGHGGAQLVVANAAAGITTFPSATATVRFLPDGPTGDEYDANATTGSGTVTISPSGANQIDVVLSFRASSDPGFKGTTIQVTGTWTC